MALSLFINYVDRGNLATAGPVLQEQLHLSATQLGTLFSAFFVTYVLGMVPGGWLADRYGAKLVLGAGAAIWSTATLLTGFASGFISLLLLRLLLGLGETAAFPSTSKLIATSIANAHIGLANGAIGFAYLVGPAVGTFAGGLLMARLGWRPVFVIFGILSLLWLFPWSRVVVAEPSSGAGAAADESPMFREILHQRSLWGVALGCFAGSYGYYAMLAWLPTYLVKARGLSIEWMTGVASAAYAINAASALAAGWAIDRWVRSGRSMTLAWKLPMGFGYSVLIVCTIGFAVLPINGCVACLFLGMVVGGVTSVGYFAIPQLLAGPRAAARFVGFTNMCGNVAGIVAPALTGMLIDAFGTYLPAFVLIGLVNVLGVVGWVLVLPKIAPIRWAVPPQLPPAAISPPGAL
jgi:MFS family permease